MTNEELATQEALAQERRAICINMSEESLPVHMYKLGFLRACELKTKEESIKKFIVYFDALQLLQKDSHQWSSRPCATCKQISTTFQYDFGCVRYASDKKIQMQKGGTSNF